MRSALVCLLVLAGLVGCSSSDDAPSLDADTTSTAGADLDEAALADGLAAMYAGDNPDPDDLTEGECFAAALLGSTTAEQLREGGLVDASYAVVTAIPTLGSDLAGPVADAQLACTDFIADSTSAQVSITKGGLDADAYATCLRGELDQQQIKDSVVASLMGEWGDPALQALSEAQATCADQ